MNIVNAGRRQLRSINSTKLTVVAAIACLMFGASVGMLLTDESTWLDQGSQGTTEPMTARTATVGTATAGETASLYYVMNDYLTIQFSKSTHYFIINNTVAGTTLLSKGYMYLAYYNASSQYINSYNFYSTYSATDGSFSDDFGSGKYLNCSFTEGATSHPDIYIVFYVYDTAPLFLYKIGFNNTCGDIRVTTMNFGANSGASGTAMIATTTGAADVKYTYYSSQTLTGHDLTDGVLHGVNVGTYTSPAFGTLYEPLETNSVSYGLVTQTWCMLQAALRYDSTYSTSVLKDLRFALFGSPMAPSIDCDRYKVSNETFFWTDTVFIGFGDAQERQADFYDLMQAHNTFTDPTDDWNWGEKAYHTWYDYNRDINETIIYDLIDKIADGWVDKNITKLIIDDGWQMDYGDWRINTSKFPSGFDDLISYAHTAGIDLGLWFGPLMMSDEVSYCQSNEHMLLNLSTGANASISSLGSDPMIYYLDPTRDDVLDFISEAIENVTDTLFDYYKIDMVYFDAAGITTVGLNFTDGSTRVEARESFLSWLRDEFPSSAALAQSMHNPLNANYGQAYAAFVDFNTFTNATLINWATTKNYYRNIFGPEYGGGDSTPANIASVYPTTNVFTTVTLHDWFIGSNAHMGAIATTDQDYLDILNTTYPRMFTEGPTWLDFLDVNPAKVGYRSVDLNGMEVTLVGVFNWAETANEYTFTPEDVSMGTSGVWATFDHSYYGTVAASEDISVILPAMGAELFILRTPTATPIYVTADIYLLATDYILSTADTTENITLSYLGEGGYSITWAIDWAVNWLDDLALSSTETVNVVVSEWEPSSQNVMAAWTADAAASYVIGGLPDMGYKVTLDGSVIAIGYGPSFSFTATDGGSFEVVVWYEKTVSTLIVLTVNMVGLGMMVAVVGGWVMPFARDIKRGRYNSRPEEMIPQVIKCVVFIVVASAMWVLLESIAIG